MVQHETVADREVRKVVTQGVQRMHLAPQRFSTIGLSLPERLPNEVDLLVCDTRALLEASR